MWRRLHLLYLATVCCLSLLHCPLGADAEVYKCPDGKGGSVFRNVPCSADQTPIVEGDRQKTVTPRVAPSPPAAAPPPASQQAPPSGPPQVERVPLPSPQEASDATCVTLGKGAESIAILRDRGRPASEFLAMFHEAALKTGGAEGAYWEKATRSMVLTIYANPWWTPAVARQRIELACLQARELK